MFNGIARRRVLVYVGAFLIGGLVWHINTTESGSPTLVRRIKSTAFRDDVSHYVAKPNASLAFRGKRDAPRLQLGDLTSEFPENLRPEWNYVTTWNSAGMTNVFEGYVNLLYLALISERVAVLPPFVPAPNHLAHSAPYLNFGDVYDLPQLRLAIRSPIIEWADLKIARYGEGVPWKTSLTPGIELEELGCWSPSQFMPGRGPQRSSLEKFLQLDVAYRPIPPDSVLPGGSHVQLWSLAYLLDPEGRREGLSAKNIETGMTLISKKTVPPDEQFGCFDDLYPTGVFRSYEWEHDISPAWRFVGRHMRFTKSVTLLAEDILRRALGIDVGRVIPPYISLHIRRDDFDGANKMCKPGDKCALRPPLSAYAKRIQEVQALLRAKFGDSPKGNVVQILVTSDEPDHAWWREVRQMGWSYVNHTQEETVSPFGAWQPALVDAVIQAGGIGFVGTQRSTMTRVAALRVRDWNGGVSRNVAWSGGKGG